MESESFPAPDLQGITHWINSGPLSIKQLAGKVVGIEFWTHSCGNCDNAVPEMQKLYEKYSPQGFVLIGVHTPELPTDKEVERIQDYVKRKKLTFPIAVDNDMMTWRAYGQKYWPTLYLIDQEGNVFSRHIGEGGYLRIEKDLLHLLERS
jgi:thiol-disulfide isomerase/thioredoxin